LTVEALEAGTTIWANQVIFDRLIVDCNGDDAGMVDDLELTDLGAGEGLAWTGILCGPTALGPRIGGRIGVWWLAVGRRLRPGGKPDPVHIPVDFITKLDHREVRLRVTRSEAGTQALHDWVDEKVISRIPGSNR
jgi:hypothetical protein